MMHDRVAIYFSRIGAPLQVHERSTLMAVARDIAEIKGCEFGGCYDAGDDCGSTFFVPEDSLIADEAVSLAISGPQDLFGGVVPYPFVKTKAITHSLLDAQSVRPDGWSADFAAKVCDAVLPGYTVFSADDAHRAAVRLLPIGPVRAKPSLATGGRAQRVLSTLAEIDAFLERLDPDQLISYGLVIEPDLHRLMTLSVGQITLDDQMLTYCGTQRLVTDNEGRSIYGGSDLLCVRGSWSALDKLSLSGHLRTAVAQAKTYDGAMASYPGFFASRRNYDIGQGIDAVGDWRSGVFEASWRVGGASPAEVAALAEFQHNPNLQIVKASTVKEFGRNRHPPEGAVVHFCDDDPEAGPVMRYTLVTHRPEASQGADLFRSIMNSNREPHQSSRDGTI